MTHELTAWLTKQIDDAETRTRELLYWAQQTILTLEEPRLLGKEIPGWYHWPAVERACTERLAELAAMRQILADHAADVHRCDGGDFATGDDCPIKRQMAAPHVAQPGYRTEWGPQ